MEANQVKHVYCLTMQSQADVPRYSNRDFPPYTFIPGQSPHPTRDPDGHSYGQPHDEQIEFSVEQWQQCDAYLYGIDLFNHDYWWEAHEALEGVWIAAGRTTTTGYFIQGLIQIAVARLKQHQTYTDVARQMAAEGLDKMHPIKGHFLGIDLLKFREDVKEFIAEPGSKKIRINLALDFEQTSD